MGRAPKLENDKSAAILKDLLNTIREAGLVGPGDPFFSAADARILMDAMPGSADLKAEALDEARKISGDDQGDSFGEMKKEGDKETDVADIFEEIPPTQPTPAWANTGKKKWKSKASDPSLWGPGSGPQNHLMASNIASAIDLTATDQAVRKAREDIGNLVGAQQFTQKSLEDLGKKVDALHDDLRAFADRMGVVLDLKTFEANLKAAREAKNPDQPSGAGPGRRWNGQVVFTSFQRDVRVTFDHPLPADDYLVILNPGDYNFPACTATEKDRSGFTISLSFLNQPPPAAAAPWHYFWEAIVP